jgi:transcriptional regulator with XRE-family HTH domain
MTTTVTQSVASEVRAELARKRIPQADLAEVLGVSQAGISRRLSGDTPFDVNEVAAVADFLGVPIALLFGDSAA